MKENKLKNLSKGLLLFLSISSTIALGLVAIGALWVIPQFEDVFSGFDTEAPFITNMVLFSYKLWWLLPVTTLIVGVDLAKRKSITSQHITLASSLFIGGFILAFLLFVFSLLALYAPVGEYK